MGDWLCIVAVVLYAVNRWLVKPGVPTGFLHDHFNDLLLIPAALPVVLAVQRALGWRDHDRVPSAGEIAMHLVVWATVCEGVGPAVFHRGVADLGDVVAYAVGALGGWIWWHRCELQPRVSERGL